MSLIKYEPYSLLDQLQREFFRNSGYPYSREGTDDDNSNIEVSDWRPAVDIKEEKERYVIHADLPGVEAKDIDITMENGILTLKGERKMDKEEQHDGYKRVERVRGTFYRRFSLPDTADTDNIGANSRDGVLEITVPKHAKVQPRRITVSN
ncbi:MAG: Hsp20/alpha crystallin family protein [Gammaproteobacteria bacterium]|nr:Hsp20/alpha crystallin family protein [Gammaproteobacteria bacterium]